MPPAEKTRSSPLDILKLIEAPLGAPVDKWSVAFEAEGEPNVSCYGGVRGRRNSFLRYRCFFLRQRRTRCRKHLSEYALNCLRGLSTFKSFTRHRPQPTITQHDVEILLLWVFEHGCRLRIEGGSGSIRRACFAEIGERPVESFCDRRSTRVWEVAGGSGGDQIVLRSSAEVGDAFARVRWAGFRKMR